MVAATGYSEAELRTMAVSHFDVVFRRWRRNGTRFTRAIDSHLIAEPGSARRQGLQTVCAGSTQTTEIDLDQCAFLPVNFCRPGMNR